MTQRRSTDLLAQLTAEAYATEYPVKQERAPIRRRWWASSIAVSAAITLVITAGLTSTRLLAPQRQQQRGELTQRLADVRQSTLALSRANQELRADVRRLSVAGLTDSGTGRALLARLAKAERAAGTTSATGPGLCVTLSQPEDARDSTVTDRDMQRLANDLWRAGARAMAINGLRLTSRSAIRTAGEAILVSYRALAWPYRVCALDPAAPAQPLSPAVLDGVLNRFAGDYGVKSKTERSPLTLPAARIVE